MSNLSKTLLATIALTLLGLNFSPPVAAISAEPTEYSEEILIEIGRRIYQAGEMADGSPVKAFVLGNIEVTGDQFTCLSCHRRSGLGGPEGTKNVLPTNGALLLTPRVNLYMERPAYTLATFADSLAMGVNPNGEPFDQIMPIYDLPALEMKALFTYLKTLSNDYSPGLTEETLHIATVIGKNVDPQLRKEMLTIINTFFDLKNTGQRKENKRFQSGTYYHEFRNKDYRRWLLHTWELSGLAESWPAQLEEHYRHQPVFAMVSGLVTGDWEPIHDFCQAKKLPCLLPNTDLPAIEEPAGYYTLYYSQGLTLEAQVLGARISSREEIDNVLQVSRQGLAGEKGAQTLREILHRKGIETGDILLGPGKTDWEAYRKKLNRLQPKAIVLWLEETDLNRFASELAPTVANIPLYLSSSRLNGNLDLVHDTIKQHGTAVHPFFLPKDQQNRLSRFATWLRIKQIPLTNPQVQEQTYYACLTLNAGLTHIKPYFYREYLLDVLDHSEEMAIYSGSYPRLSFGPEQRFLAKGAYIINLGTEDADWVVPGH
jgi:ABC-type branched-subunit amino acid transport system substrate-binding protein